jgi:hypothetical protein
MVTKVTDARWAKVFTDAGIRTTAHDDLQSWLRTHAVMFVPMVTAGHIARRGAAAVSRGMRLLTRALGEGFGLVRELGNTITPASMVLLVASWALQTRFRPCREDASASSLSRSRYTFRASADLADMAPPRKPAFMRAHTPRHSTDKCPLLRGRRGVPPGAGKIIWVWLSNAGVQVCLRRSSHPQFEQADCLGIEDQFL